MRGLRPKLQRLDNEFSHMLKYDMDEIQVDWQLVPPGIQRRDATQRAIKTFNNHFKSGLATTYE